MPGIPTAWRSTFSYPRHTDSSSEYAHALSRIPEFHLQGQRQTHRRDHPHRQRHQRHDLLSQGLQAGTKFILENPRTQPKVEVNGVRPAQLNPALTPVEFLAAAPQFWNSSFPPGMNGSIRKDASSRTQRRISFQESDAVPPSDSRTRQPCGYSGQSRPEPRGRSHATVCRYY